MAQYRPMAVAVLFPLPDGSSAESFLNSGLQRLVALPPDGLKAMRYMPVEPGSVLVSFHASRYVDIKQWQKRLTEAYGDDFGALVVKQTVTDTFETHRDNLHRFGVLTYYKVEGSRLVEDCARGTKRRRTTKAVTVEVAADETSRLEQVRVADSGGSHGMLVRQAKLELVPLNENLKAECNTAGKVVVSAGSLSMLASVSSAMPPSKLVMPPSKSVMPPPRSAMPASKLPVPVPKSALVCQSALVCPSVQRQVQSLDSSSLFDQGEYKKKLLEFLSNTRPYHIPGELQPLKQDESVAEFLRRLNVQPMGVGIINKLLPSVLRTRDAYKNVEGLDEEHVSLLTRLNWFFRTYNWEGGLWTLCPQINMEYYKYDVSEDKFTIGCSLFELVRRALKLEGAVACKISELYEIVKRTPSMIVIPNVAQGIARLLLEHNCGRLDDGGSYPFFLQHAQEDNVTRRLSKGLDGVTLELLHSLQEGRRAAFTGLYQMESPLAWFLPTVAFLYRHRELLSGVDKKCNAEALKRAIDSEWKERKAAYFAGVRRVAVYGAHLTRLVMHIRSSCGVFFEKRTEGVEVSKYPRLIALDKNGRMKGPDGMSLPFGHFDPSALRGLLPFDIELTKMSQIPFEEAQAIVERQIKKEDACIGAMLADCGIVPADCPALRCMLNARRRVAWILRNDTHLKMLTAILPPTASMPEAVFSPKELYKPFDV